MLNKMLVIVLLSTFTLNTKIPVFKFVPISNTHVRNGPSVSFGTNVPCIYQTHIYIYNV